MLPFRVLRLTVVHLDAGIPMFTHTWKSGRGLIDEDLFSGLMHGLRLIIRESILHGEFRDINLDVASIIINRVKDFPVMAILVTRKSSRVLRQALSTFTERFIEKFRNALVKPNDSTQFEGAKILVQECFNFLPEFD